MTRLIRLRKKEEDGLNTAKTVHVELGNKYFESAEYEKALIECYKEKGDKIALKHAERLYARFLD